MLAPTQTPAPQVCAGQSPQSLCLPVGVWHCLPSMGLSSFKEMDAPVLLSILRTEILHTYTHIHIYTYICVYISLYMFNSIFLRSFHSKISWKNWHDRYTIFLSTNICICLHQSVFSVSTPPSSLQKPRASQSCPHSIVESPFLFFPASAQLALVKQCLGSQE